MSLMQFTFNQASPGKSQIDGDFLQTILTSQGAYTQAWLTREMVGYNDRISSLEHRATVKRIFKMGIFAEFNGSSFLLPEITVEQIRNALLNAPKAANGIIDVNLREIQEGNKENPDFPTRILSLHETMGYIF